MKAIDQFFADSSKPDTFDENSPEDAMVQADLLFQNLCSILESQGVVNAKQLTTLEFYARLDYFRKQNTPKNL